MLPIFISGRKLSQSTARQNICYQYSLAEGNCRSRRQGNCKYWHICKSYVEGKCEGICSLSHDFHSEDNKEIAEELGLEKYSNETVRNIVGWSLPQVCQSYLRNECELSECPYLHICAQFVEGSSCKCSMSHNLTDSHNNIILEHYDLVLPNQVTNVDFVRCSVLVLDEQRAIGTGKSVESSDTVTQKTTSAAVTNNKGDTSLLGNTAEANPAIKQNPLSANVCPVTSPAKIKEQENAQIAKVLFETLCKEFNCSAPLDVLNKREDLKVKNIQDVSLFLQENNDTFLFTRSESGNIERIIAFCSKLRLCPRAARCKSKCCPYFHLCKMFITGSCTRGGKCRRSHTFRNSRDHKTVLELKLDWLTNEQLRRLMLSSTPQVCINYNKGECNNEETCPRIHICKNFVLDDCRGTTNCPFRHVDALYTHHTNSLLEKYQLGKTAPFSIFDWYIFVCEEDDNESLSRENPTAASINFLPPAPTETPGVINYSLTSLESQQQKVSLFEPSIPLKSELKDSSEAFSSNQPRSAIERNISFSTEKKGKSSVRRKCKYTFLSKPSLKTWVSCLLCFGKIGVGGGGGGGGEKRRARNDVLTTCKAVNPRASQRPSKAVVCFLMISTLALSVE